MSYKELNENQRRQMREISDTDSPIAWVDPGLMDTLLGKLPFIRHYQREGEASDEIRDLERLLESYNAFHTDKEEFLQGIALSINRIQEKQEHWFGLSLAEIEESVRQHEFCLISGEAGVGKSYFIMELEEKLTEKGIPHLCIYGKFLKDLENIKFAEIIDNSSDGFVFIVDAVNEMSISGKAQLLHLLNDLKKHRQIRIIVTYRIHAIAEDLLAKLQALAQAEYIFLGVSFESALQGLLSSPVPDVYKFEDILFSNNALLLSMLSKILVDPKISFERLNSIASATFILERFVMESTKRITRDSMKYRGLDIWEDTKLVADWMFNEESKDIEEEELLSLVGSGTAFLEIMNQTGLMMKYEYDGKNYWSFSMEALTDFLIARSVFKKIDKMTFNECAETLKRKVRNMGTLSEALILALLDKYAPNYGFVHKLLVEADLFETLSYETLVKANFKKTDIPQFISVFEPLAPDQLLGIFGGYTDKPFNCTNYLNHYYSDPRVQCINLSFTLSQPYSYGKIKGRLKNILYFITLNNRSDRRDEEALYFSLWCCAAPNKDIRCLAMKLMYGVVQKNPTFIPILIDRYENLTDIYIKDAVVYVLSSCQPGDAQIIRFFNHLIHKEVHLMARSVRRIATYLGVPYGYIHWDREDLYHHDPDAQISESLEHLLFQVDLLDKELLPFRYWGKDRVNMHTEFLRKNKHEVSMINKYFEDNFSCVKDGYCNGRLPFKKYVGAFLPHDCDQDTLDINSFLCSFESVLTSVLNKYQLEMADITLRHEDFHNSIYRKCFDIASEVFMGSLMCNYYASDFATYNGRQENIGFEVYDPLEYGESVRITAPLPVNQKDVKRLDEMVLNGLDTSYLKDHEWVRDASLSRKNLLSLLTVLTYGGVEWVMLAGRILLQERVKYSMSLWKDSYEIFACLSEEETISEYGARSLTIDLDNYEGSLAQYHQETSVPWLCKNILDIEERPSIFEEASPILPPAELISHFQLQPNLADASWDTNDGEKIILFNGKNQRYRDSVSGTVYMRKEYLDKYLADHRLKYFAYTERSIQETGYAPETSIHFELQNGAIVKEILNLSDDADLSVFQNPLCEKCPHGIDRHEVNNVALKDRLNQIWKGMDKYFPST